MHLVILDLIQTADEIKPEPNYLWIPPWVYQSITAHQGTSLLFESFQRQNNLNVIIVQGLNIGVLAHCKEVPPRQFIGYPTEFNRANSRSCAFIKFPLKTRLNQIKTKTLSLK